MVARIRKRWSKAATWSRRLGTFAIPALVLTILAFRLDHMDGTGLFTLLAVIWLIALLAVGLAIYAFVDIWRDGLIGAGKAAAGMFWGLAALAIPATAAVLLVQYPILNDVSTDLDDPPFFRTAPAQRTEVMNVHGAISDEQAATQQAGYPDIATRRYEADTARLFAAARYVVGGEDWQVIDEIAPIDDRAPARIEAVARTMIFGFRDDIVIRILPDPAGSRLDIRSASRMGRHDLGTNARRIRAFLKAIDNALLNAPLDYDPAGV
ncbi:MAG: DUF1499 domain-containing protein [Hyphomicrobiales bacterium]